MTQMKYTMLISALAAASLFAVGCEQRPASGDKVGQASNPTKPSLMAQNGQTQNDQTQNQAQPQNDQAQTQNNQAQTGAMAQQAGKSVDDGMITVKVKAALLAEPGLKSSQIDVATKDATVTLSGSIDSDQMRNRAKQIALATEGVKDVIDNLNVRTTS